MSNKENTQEEEIKNTKQEPQVEENQEVVKEEPTAEELIQAEKDKSSGCLPSLKIIKKELLKNE